MHTFILREVDPKGHYAVETLMDGEVVQAGAACIDKTNGMWAVRPHERSEDLFVEGRFSTLEKVRTYLERTSGGSVEMQTTERDTFNGTGEPVMNIRARTKANAAKRKAEEAAAKKEARAPKPKAVATTAPARASSSGDGVNMKRGGAKRLAFEQARGNVMVYVSETAPSRTLTPDTLTSEDARHDLIRALEERVSYVNKGEEMGFTVYVMADTMHAIADHFNRELAAQPEDAAFQKMAQVMTRTVEAGGWYGKP